MSTQEAINYILKNDPEANQYRLAKALGCSHTTIRHYVKGVTRMSEEIYNRFKKIYPTIEIDDIRYPKKYKLGNLK